MTGLPGTVEANRLYWETEMPVADIAARFDLSRRALYGIVQPVSAGAECPHCGGHLRFENRLGRRTRTATCASCHARVEMTAHADDDRTSVPARELATVAPDARGFDARSTDVRTRAVLIGGAALAGVAIGGVAAWLARRRD